MKLWMFVKNVVSLENWLSKDGKFVSNPHFLGFSVGKRNCPGKTVAIRSVYAFFGNIIMKYKFEFWNKNDTIKQDADFILKLDPQVGLKATKRSSI